MSESVAVLQPDPVISLKRPAENGSEADNESDNKRVKPDFLRVKRRKFAMLICYSGQGYLGLQRNPGRKTIEEDILLALHKAGIINEEAYQQQKLIDFQRAARTDKGVSAIRQVLSVKLPEDLSIKSINEHLPEQIRVVGVKRTTKGFNCKGNCDARTYAYTMPTFALAPQSEPITYSYRISPAIIEKTNEVLQNYVGTHNYHNFTSRKKPADPSAHRYIINISCESPVIADDMEFVTLKVKGQSFMLHQIRKMVGLAIAIVRGITDVSTISKAWDEPKLDLPVAPGLGLVLEEVHYDRYNKRYGSDGIHDKIEWHEFEEELNEFKRKFIVSNIMKVEREEKSMENWLEILPGHSYDVRTENRNNVDDEEEDDCDDETPRKNNVSKKP